MTSESNTAPTSPSNGDDASRMQGMVSLVEGQAKLVAALVSDRTSLHNQSCSGEFVGADSAASRQLAWAQIKMDTNAPKFSGEDPSIYRRWKSSLKSEVEGLNRSVQDQLQLLALRTKGSAAEIVKRSDHMAAENPEEALEFAWRLLDKRFGSHPKAAKDLLKELEDFKLVYGNNKDQMWRFAQACQEASALMKTDQGHELKMLDFPAARLNACNNTFAIRVVGKMEELFLQIQDGQRRVPPISGIL